MIARDIEACGDDRDDPSVNDLGSQDLEKGLRPSRASAFATVAVNAILLLAVFNSGGLVRWTQQLPSSPVAAWVAERAADWDRLMHVPPPEIFQYVKKLFTTGE
jgi:hypothetical protein